MDVPRKHMQSPFAHQTAARLAAAAVPEEPLTPMERAVIRRQFLSVSREEQRHTHLWAWPRPSVAWWTDSRLPRPNVKTAKVEGHRYYCPQCVRVTPDAFGFKHHHGGELTWASVDGQLDGGPECPTCMAPYWETWRHVLHRIAEYAVTECHRKAGEIKKQFKSPYSVDAILLGGTHLGWNPR